jgi:hypothetical protein
VNTGDWIVLISGAAAALVALIGYMVNQYVTRNERRRRIYAEALAVVFEYQELPYRIRKRQDSLASCSEIALKVSDVFEQLSFYRYLTSFESTLVGQAYGVLIDVTQDQGGPYRDSAWRESPAGAAKEFHFPNPDYNYENQEERTLCLEVMDEELRVLSFLTRRRTRRKIARFQTSRRERAVTAGGSP